MPVLWFILAGISIFMLIFSFTELDDTFAMFLSAGWFGVFMVCIFEAITYTRARVRKPSSAEQREAYYQRMRRLSARTPRR